LKFISIDRVVDGANRTSLCGRGVWEGETGVGGIRVGVISGEGCPATSGRGKLAECKEAGEEGRDGADVAGVEFAVDVDANGELIAVGVGSGRNSVTRAGTGSAGVCTICIGSKVHSEVGAGEYSICGSGTCCPRAEGDIGNSSLCHVPGISATGRSHVAVKVTP
jgi:hypothetical protein